MGTDIERDYERENNPTGLKEGEFVRYRTTYMGDVHGRLFALSARDNVCTLKAGDKVFNCALSRVRRTSGAASATGQKRVKAKRRLDRDIKELFEMLSVEDKQAFLRELS